MRESTVEKHLVKKVRALRGLAYKFASPGRRHVEDRLVLLPRGRAWFIETKAPGEKPRPGQLREHERHRRLGFRVVILDTIEKVDAWANARAQENYVYHRLRRGYVEGVSSAGMP